MLAPALSQLSFWSMTNWLWMSANLQSMIRSKEFWLKPVKRQTWPTALGLYTTTGQVDSAEVLLWKSSGDCVWVKGILLSFLPQKQGWGRWECAAFAVQPGSCAWISSGHDSSACRVMQQQHSMSFPIPNMTDRKSLRQPNKNTVLAEVWEKNEILKCLCPCFPDYWCIRALECLCTPYPE